MNDDHFVTFLMKIFHWLSLVSFPDYFSAREGGRGGGGGGESWPIQFLFRAV